MVDWSLEEIYHRLNKNTPRIAIIGGSIDHPARLVDFETVAMAAIRIWQNGGVPFHFLTPVMCDGTAQSNQGMSYSLESRNVTTQIIINQMESHSYHGAFVIQSCDKQPFAVVNALAHLDYIRQRRGEAPVFATFVPAHVLKGGTIPDLFDYSLTQGRDIFALATHCCSGKIRGMETLFYELMQNGIHIDLDAPTVMGRSWASRLESKENLPATGVECNPIILSKPRRSFSGVDVLKGNFFEVL